MNALARHVILFTCLPTLLFASSVRADDPVQPRYLIIHSDDAGMSHSANRGTIDAMEQGIVSSASIMVPCSWFVEIAEYARTHPERDFGVHLTLTCEWKTYRWGPVASRDRVPSLLDEQGYFWRSTEQVAQHAKAEEVELELRAQIDRAREFGVPLTHLDTHMGSVVSRPDLLEIYVRLGIEYDLPVLFLRGLSERLATEYPALAETGAAMLKRLHEQRLPVLDQMAQFYSPPPGKTRKQAYLECLRDLPAGVSQLIVHCGYDDPELRAITNSAPARDEDRRVFSDPEVIQLIKQQGITVITWKQFREMRAAQNP